jgi:hypothetical protein
MDELETTDRTLGALLTLLGAPAKQVGGRCLDLVRARARAALDGAENGLESIADLNKRLNTIVCVLRQQHQVATELERRLLLRRAGSLRTTACELAMTNPGEALRLLEEAARMDAAAAALSQEIRPVLRLVETPDP